MSLITQCPACATLFKVVHDQLRMSDGWVRCGQCDEVFDASANIRGDTFITEAAAGPAQVAVEEQASNHPEDSAEHLDTEFSTTDVASEPLTSVSISEQSEPMDIPLGDESSAVDPFLEKSPKELSDFSAAVSAASRHDDLVVEPQTVDGSGPEHRYMQMFAQSSDAHPDPKLSFMRPTRPRSVWRHRWMRLTLGFCSVLLLALALTQVLVHERNRLAAQFPEFRSELVSLCSLWGCEVQALQHIESVVIDSSAFSKVRNEVYKLSFTLRNTSSMALSTPAMELTLTDVHDQVLTRRVLTPMDFATVPSVMEAGVEVSATLPLSVRMPVPVERVAGYRLLAFYP